MDELKASATHVAAATDPSDLVPLRGRGWFVPYQQLETEKQEEHERQNAENGLGAGPYQSYCYMCSSYDTQQTNPYRTAIQNLMGLVSCMEQPTVINHISRYYDKHVFPLTGKPWGIALIRQHMVSHVIDPIAITIENIRGVQAHIDAHVENMETVTEAVVVPPPEEGEDPPVEPPRKRRRVVNEKAEASYMKLVRLQMQLTSHYDKQLQRGSSNIGGGGFSTNGNNNNNNHK